MNTTPVFRKNIKASLLSNIVVNQGGSSSSKTYSILQFLLILLQYDTKGDITSVVAETIPHLKRGALRDFTKIIEENGVRLVENKAALYFETKKGARIEFFSAESPDRLRGARRKRLFINECNNIKYESYYQLAMRTSGLIILDYNPTHEFWVQTEILNNPAYNAQFIRSTYRDNQYCPQSAIDMIEARRERNPAWYKVYGEGETGTLEGLIFPNFLIIPSIPDNFKRLGTGLDFGYTNHPSAAIDLYIYDDKILYDEIIYENGLQNKIIASRLEQEKCIEVIADCAEPKSIDEIFSYGINIKPCIKGSDSIRFGIDLIKQYDIFVTARSINLIRELRNYKWLTDKNGKALNVPIDLFDHAIDAVRYITVAKLFKPLKEHLPEFV